MFIEGSLMYTYLLFLIDCIDCIRKRMRVNLFSVNKILTHLSD